MRTIFIFAVLMVAAIAGILIRQDPGYALFSYQNWTIEMALNVSAGSEIAVKITQAQLQYQGGQFDQSAKTLMALHEELPHNPKVLKLLCTLFEALQDWDSLYKLLPVVRKNKVFSEDTL